MTDQPMGAVETARAIAEDWAALTFSPDPQVTGPIVRMMMDSREAVVDYTGALGLHHVMGRGHHYGPGLWVEGGPRADWTSVYYHRADSKGIGFDRSASGSNAVGQYASQVAEVYGGTVIEERHRHRYEVDIQYRAQLEKCGLIFSGMSPDGRLPEIVEVKDHPWFIGVQFHPELKSKPFAPHPLFADFVRAAVEVSRLV